LKFDLEKLGSMLSLATRKGWQRSRLGLMHSGRFL